MELLFCTFTNYNCTIYPHMSMYCAKSDIREINAILRLYLRCVPYKKKKMSNAEEFLQYYNLIDQFIKNHEQFESHASFSQKVKNSKNKVVKKFSDELISLGELRNAIVHNPKIKGKPIAEPHIETVERIKNLHHKITNPKRVIPTFQFEVLGAKEEDFINDILIEMKKRSFSQFPVFNEKENVVELINTNTISRWLSDNMEENGTIVTENVKVKDLIPLIEFKKNYKFISSKVSVYEAYDMFLNQIINKQRNLDVLFITKSGDTNEELLGLVTIEDIAPEIKN